MRPWKLESVALSCLLLVICLAAPAKADQIINLSVAGTVTCNSSTCGVSGPLSGAYSLDVTTQTIVGPWSFSTPFGTFSSSEAGAFANLTYSAGYVGANIGISTASPPVFEYVLLYYPASDTQQTGALGPSYACSPVPGAESCYPENTVSGTTSAASANFTSLQGGAHSAPVLMPSGAPVAGVGGTLATGAQNYYEFVWPGGDFESGLSMPDLVGYPDTGSVVFELTSAKSASTIIAKYVFLIKQTNAINQLIIADGLNPGAYIIGMQEIEKGSGAAANAPSTAAPAFNLTFQTPVNGFDTLYNFNIKHSKTEYLQFGTLVQGTDGNFYGITFYGGVNSLGSFYKITASGKATTLYSFCSLGGSACTDGSYPKATPVQASDGNFYGTTAGGGAEIQNGKYTSGTIYRITPSGQLTTLYLFCSLSGCSDGYEPEGGLALGSDGNFYGTTVDGGAYKKGTIFQFNPNGTLTTLYSFCAQGGSPDCVDGENPFAALIQGTDGNFYGTTSNGGAYNYGTVYRITPGGALTTLYTFCPELGCPGGFEPGGTLIQASDGNFYGTSDETLFQMTPSGAMTSLYTGPFTGGLVQGSDGNLYGIAGGGANGEGIVFQANLSGTSLTTLYNFCSQGGATCTDGELPESTLLQATNGDFFGTTTAGGAHGDGTIFTLSAGLGPFVEAQPTPVMWERPSQFWVPS